MQPYRNSFLCPAVFFLLTISGQAHAAPSPNVVGGDIVLSPNPISRSTVRLLMMYANDERGLCTGSLLGDSVVLTAAHCVSDDPIIVRIDFFGAGGIREYRLGSRFLFHDRYDNENIGQRNDLALIAFEGGIPAENTPARVLSKDISEVTTGAIGIAGYGLTSAEGEPDDNLRVAQLAIGERNGDAIELKSAGQLASGCSGDSGGPAYVEIDGQPFVWGVASYVTEPYCQASTYYTNLALYFDWLRDSTQRLLSAPAEPPTPLKPLPKRSVSTFLRGYSKKTTDPSRLAALVEWVRGIKTGLGIDVASAMEILMAVAAEPVRLEAYLKLSPHIRFESLRQARTLLYIFSDPLARQTAEKTLAPLGIYYLRDK